MNFQEKHPRCKFCFYYDKNRCSLKGQQLISSVLEACFCKEYTVLKKGGY